MLEPLPLFPLPLIMPHLISLHLIIPPLITPPPTLDSLIIKISFHHRFYQQSTGVLKIFALEVEDSNQYKCTAKNGDDSDISYDFNILVSSSTSQQTPSFPLFPNKRPSKESERILSY